MERKFPSIFNNIPRHEVAEENKKYLQQFLEVSRENMSNKFCDLKAYECFKKILPLVETTVFSRFILQYFNF